MATIRSVFVVAPDGRIMQAVAIMPTEVPEMARLQMMVTMLDQYIRKETTP